MTPTQSPLTIASNLQCRMLACMRSFHFASKNGIFPFWGPAEMLQAGSTSELALASERLTNPRGGPLTSQSAARSLVSPAGVKLHTSSLAFNAPAYRVSATEALHFRVNEN